MYYIIQENLFREHHYNTLVDYLKRYGLEYETVKYRPFGGDLEVKSDRKDVWFFGSVNGAQAAMGHGWYPGSLYNDSHDFEVYAPKYGEHMLNADGLIISADEPLPEYTPAMFFARPTKDTKVFSGQVFTKESWEEWIKEVRQNSSMGHLTEETRILLAPLKDPIQQEIRCWIVDGKPVTISQYKIGNRINMLNMDNNGEALIFAKDMCKLFCPADAFVLDICLYQDEYKIVEINCINCSGFYDGDMSKLIQALELKFTK